MWLRFSRWFAARNSLRDTGRAILSLEAAAGLNLIFLVIVATWRVALLMFFLQRLAALGWFSLIVATLLPITAIVLVLVALNLERAVIDVMGGFREHTSSDSAYGLLIVILLLSIFLFPFTLISYIILVYLARIRAPLEKIPSINPGD